MHLIKFANYIYHKYAQEFSSIPDTSLGVEIHPQKVNLYKNNIINLCDDFGKNSSLPMVSSLHQSLSFNPLWKRFLKLVGDFKNSIPDSNLYAILESGNDFVSGLNSFKNNLVGSSLSRKELYDFDSIVTKFQKNLHKLIKDIENIHDLKQTKEFGTWKHGPGKDQATSTLRQKTDFKKLLINKLEFEELKDNLKKSMPYHTDEEIEQEALKQLENIKKQEKQEKANKVLEKYRSSLFGKEKHKLGR